MTTEGQLGSEPSLVLTEGEDFPLQIRGEVFSFLPSCPVFISIHSSAPCVSRYCLLGFSFLLGLWSGRLGGLLKTTAPHTQAANSWVSLLAKNAEPLYLNSLISNLFRDDSSENPKLGLLTLMDRSPKESRPSGTFGTDPNCTL